MSIQTGMKMYNSQLSPFAARCRMVIYAKDLDVWLIDLPDPAHEAEFTSLAPMGKIPLLVDGGTVVPESDTICEYLEDKGLGVSLRPDAPADRAKMRLIGRIGDLYVMGPMGKLFGQINPAGRDQQLVAKELVELRKAMGWLEHYIEGPDFAVAGQLTLADCALVPVLFFFREIGPMFGQEQPFNGLPRTEAYYAAIGKNPVVAKVVAELDEALRRMMAG
ncbi:glutathione S-transferase family protein [Parvibaculum sp.]|uniref:glutathione S-transferase family protein n=1 Tax=Parvibaculum sp. TaxID=2024848 RepID=UPI003919ADEB